jgi:hypothetical protein
MVDAILEQHIECVVGIGLADATQRGRAKEGDSAHVAGATKGAFFDHGFVSLYYTSLFTKL